MSWRDEAWNGEMVSSDEISNLIKGLKKEMRNQKERNLAIWRGKWGEGS